MTGLAVAGWGTAALSLICAAVGLWHHRRGAARVARCAHELRGPLGALRLGLDLALAHRGLTPERLRALDLQLSRATLALTELEGPRATGAVREPVEVDGLISDCVAALRPLGARRGVAVEVGEVSDAHVLGSRAGLAQALGNLIQNALEHGAGPVRVQARGGEGTVRLEVTDSGPGLTRPLSRLLRGRGWGRAWAAATGPHGHGLRVAASVAAAHGGRLLSAPAEQGARLVLELPLTYRAVANSPGARRAAWRGTKNR